MKTCTLGRHDLKLLVSFLQEVPAYLSSQLGDYSKREIRIRAADRSSVLSAIDAELATTRCTARSRRLSGLRSALEDHVAFEGSVQDRVRPKEERES